MRCPLCLDQELEPHVRRGVETDHCPRCRGIWLDRGELEKLLDVAESRSPARAPTDRSDDRGREPVRRDDDRRGGDRGREDRGWDDDRGSRSKKSKKKRKGAFAEMLEDVLDVFD